MKTSVKRYERPSPDLSARSHLAIFVDINKQDACTGVRSACRREENRKNMEIWVLRLRQGHDADISWS